MRCNEKKTWPINKINLTKLFFMGIRKRLELIDDEFKNKTTTEENCYLRACDRVIAASFSTFEYTLSRCGIFDVQVHHEKINKFRGL